VSSFGHTRPIVHASGFLKSGARIGEGDCMTPLSGPSLDLVLASAIAGARRSLRRLARRA
jgi:hypothetical protein